MPSDLQYEDPEMAWQHAVSTRSQRLRRNVAFYVTTYAVGLVLLVFLGVRTLPGDVIQWVLVGGALLLWSGFLLWSFRDTFSAARRLSNKTRLTADTLVLTGVPDPIPIREVTQVFWNPGLPYFILLRGRLAPGSPFVVVRKADLVDPTAVRVALRDVVNVLDSPSMTLKSLAAELARQRKNPNEEYSHGGS